MAEEAQPDVTQASAITMQAYRQIAASYARRNQRGNLPSFWQEHMQRFVQDVQASPAWQADRILPVLDVGCGHGRDALLLAEQGLQVRAIDLSPEMLAEARQHCLNQSGSERITFQRMDMRHLEFPAASAAGVWVSASFLHIPKQENLLVLRELERVLIPGGVFTLLVKETDGGPDERYDPMPENGSLRFFARYRGGELWSLLERAGLRVLRMTSTTGKESQNWLGVLAQKPV
jgi:ubiquinone/menaquinone biosynthesis C-methylase UbiE